MPEPNDSQPDAIESQLQKVNLETAKVQLQKLNLEIEDLKEERNWEERIARFIPIITAVISIAGFLWGVVLFRNQQEKDRITREADQISRDMNQYRTSYEQLLQFSSNQNIDRKSTRLNSSHQITSYAVFCLKAPRQHQLYPISLHDALPISRFIPIITAVISIAGFLWGVVLFRNQQEKDRITREADQISRDMNQYRTSYEQLLQFSSNQNMTVARVLSLRQDLDALIDSLY